MRFWQLYQDQIQLPGSAGPSSPRVVIGPFVPAALHTFYSPNTVIAAVLAYSNATDYSYQIWVQIAATGETQYGIGQVKAGTVYQWMYFYYDPGVPDIVISMGDASASIQSWIQMSGKLLVSLGDGINPAEVDINPTTKFLIDNISAPRGTRFFHLWTLTTTGITIETGMDSSVSMVWKAGRAYRVKYLRETYNPTNSGTFAIYTMRRHSNTGTIVSLHGFYMAVANNSQLCMGEEIIVNATGADIADDIFLTLTLSGAGSLSELGGGVDQRQRTFEITDIGAATSYSGATQF